MIEENAIVISVEGNDAWVETRRQSSCSACSANKGCGTSVLSNVLGKRSSQVRVLNTLDVKPGEEVVIGIEEESLVRGSIAVYLVPLISMFLFALLAEWYAGNGNDLAAVTGAILGFVIGLFWLRKFSRKIYRDKRYQPVILRKIPGIPGTHLNVFTG